MDKGTTADFQGSSCRARVLWGCGHRTGRAPSQQGPWLHRQIEVRRTYAKWLRLASTKAATLLICVCSMVAASLAQEPRVAVLLPLSGPLSALLAGDISPLEAVRTTFATVAPAVTVTLYDTQGRPDQARYLYDRAVAADRAQIVIGPATVAELNAFPNDLSVAVFALTSADPSLVRTNLTAISTRSQAIDLASPEQCMKSRNGH